MKKSRTHWVALLAALLALPGAAGAAERGWYLGAAFSKVSPDYAPPLEFAIPYSTDAPSRLTGDGLDAIGSRGIKWLSGYQALDWLAFEADYLDLNSDSAQLAIFCITQPCGERIRAETVSASLSVLALWPFGRFDFFARAGLSRWKSTIEILNADGSRYASRDLLGIDGKFGAGAQVHFHKITARLEYERLRFDLDNADAWSLGVAYRFR